MKIIILTSLSLLFSAVSFADEALLLKLFQDQNANITEVHVMEYVINYDLNSGILVARGIKPANSFTGNWSDELFGVFQTDNKMNIVEALEYIPTKRWHDYCVEVSRKPLSNFKVRFYGCSYNDQELIREYSAE